MRRMNSIAKNLLNRSCLAQKPAYAKRKQGYYLKILVPSIGASNMHSSETTIISSARKELLHNVQGRLLVQMDCLVTRGLPYGVWTLPCWVGRKERTIVRQDNGSGKNHQHPLPNCHEHTTAKHKRRQHIMRTMR